MKALLKRLAVQFGFYDRLRYSRLYESYLQRKPHYAQSREREIAFYRELFRSRKMDLIFDVGANHGEKAVVFAELAKRVVCVEPDPRSVNALQTRFRRRPEIAIVAEALGAQAGHAQLMQQDAGSAYNSLSTKHVSIHSFQSAKPVDVQVGTLDQLIARYGVPDFLKVDVEGFEKEVFAGLSQPIPFLSFEANLPEFLDETRQVCERLMSLSTTTTYRFNAVTNDELRSWMHPDWTSAVDVIESLAKVQRGSADVYAICVDSKQTQ